MKNYLEHEVLVKFNDNILSQSTDWQWFIEEIENKCEGYNANINKWNDFISSYNDISKLYSYFVRINSIKNINLSFSKPWLKDINLIASMYCGATTLNSNWSLLTNDFIKLFAIIVFVTKLLNITNTEKYIFNARPFYQDNIYKLYNMNMVKDNNDEVVHYLKQINFIDINEILNCLNRNVLNIEKAPDITLLEKYKDQLICVNAFNYQNITLPSIVSWETQCVFDMINVRFNNTEIIPAMQIGDRTTPNISLWTKEFLNDLINYFNNDISSFVIETIRFMHHIIVPSNKTIEMHFKLVVDFLKTQQNDSSFGDINSSSLIVINKLISNNFINNELKSVYMSDYLKEIQKFIIPETIFSLKENNAIISNEQKNILSDFNNNQVKRINSMINIDDFIKYCTNKFVYKNITNEVLYQIIKTFNTIIQKDKNSASLSSIFYNLMILLIKLEKNANIDQPKLKNYIIQLQQLWQNVYYDICIKSMQTISHSAKIPNEFIDIFNKLILKNSSYFLLQCLILDEEHIFEIMELSSKYIFHMLVSKIYITKNFPKQDNEIKNLLKIDDALIITINKLQTEKGYKLLNRVNPNTLLMDLYDNYKNKTLFFASLFNKYKKLYDKVKTKITDYDLIDFDGENLYAAHLLQLFPVLENKIREFGMRVNIVPFKEKTDEFWHLKDASNVLEQIFMEAFSNTNSFNGVEDIIFIYLCMYNSRMFNIRNEASHGRDYLNDQKLLFAFKISLICLDLILDRLEIIEKNVIDNT